MDLYFYAMVVNFMEPSFMEPVDMYGKLMKLIEPGEQKGDGFAVLIDEEQVTDICKSFTLFETLKMQASSIAENILREYGEKDETPDYEIVKKRFKRDVGACAFMLLSPARKY